MTWVDFAVVGVLAVSAILAFMRGLVREVLGVGAWIGAGLAAAWGLPLLRPQVRLWVGASPWADPGTFVAIFLVVLLVLMLIAHFVGRAVRLSPLGGLDRTLGLVFGLARGAMIVCLAYIIAGLVVPVGNWPAPVLNARLIGSAFAGAHWAVHLLPAHYRPAVYPPPAGHPPTAEALLRATPQGSALSRPAARTVRE